MDLDDFLWLYDIVEKLAVKHHVTPWTNGSVDGMSESKDTKRTSISEARSVEEIADFGDVHSLDDYWDQTHEAEFEVRAKPRRRLTLEPEVYKGIEVQARRRGVLPETLINLWLAERLLSPE